MTFLSIINFITAHPLTKGHKFKALKRFIFWQINNIFNPYPVIIPFANQSKLIVRKGMTGATGNLYTGLHEFYDMGFLLHFLKQEDVFADIGANVGSYTILASAVKRATTISIEPIPDTFLYLQNNIHINSLTEKDVIALNIGLGKSDGTLKFTRNLDCVNHVLSPSEETSNNFAEVKVKTLDHIIETFSCPALIKIDVEGFEWEVINGGQNTLRNKNLKAIIIELNGSGKRYGYEDDEIHKMLTGFGFQPYTYEPFSRTLTPLASYGTHNTIYIRDYEYVKDRLEKSEKIEVLEKIF